MSGDIGAYGEELYQQVLPLHGPDPDGLAHDLVGAWSHGVREIDELVRDTPEGPGWSVILDVDAAPVKGLYWLAQLAGVELRAPRVITADRNFATMPSLEYPGDPGGAWGSIVGGITRVVDGSAYHGVAHLRAVASVAGRVFQFTPADLMIPGREYTFSLDVLAASTPVRTYVEAYTSGGASIQQFFGPPSTAPGRRALSFISPANASYVWMGFQVPATSGSDVIDTDAFMLRLGSDDHYFDGDTIGDGYSWEGTPGASASIFRRLENDDEWAVYARDAIRRQGGRNRGTPDAILSAAEDTLTGTREARLIERVSGNAYRFTLITRPSETPDPALTLARASAQVPGGSKLTLTLTEGATIDEGTKTIDSATGVLDSATLVDIAN